MSEELELLKTVTRRLDQINLPYMVTGSMAVNYYAVPRMTRDIDFVVELPFVHVGQMCNVFSEDFYIDEAAVREAIEQRGMFNIIHNASVIKVDLIVRKESEYRRIEFSRRRKVSMEGGSFFIVAAEDLILSKLDWARTLGRKSRFLTSETCWTPLRT